MRINGKRYHTIWVSEDRKTVNVIDQRCLPHQFKIVALKSSDDAYHAISNMAVRGAPLLGVTGAFGVYLAALESGGPIDHITAAAANLKSSRPTAVNLGWAIDVVMDKILKASSDSDRCTIALKTANEIKEHDIEICNQIGNNGLEIIKTISKKKNGDTVNILTHCNAGWLATIDWGTAIAPIYKASSNGIKIHVWVDETRPRNQGANLTTYELSEEGIQHTLIADNTGGHLMQQGLVDLIIVGTDRTAMNGDVANKIGTYLKALAAYDNGVPFYVALPSTTIDWSISNGAEIPIETRSENEVKYIRGFANGKIQDVLICPENTPAINYGFDITPARLVTGLITERGICEASEAGIRSLFPKIQ